MLVLVSYEVVLFFLGVQRDGSVGYWVADDDYFISTHVPELSG